MDGFRLPKWYPRTKRETKDGQTLGVISTLLTGEVSKIERTSEEIRAELSSLKASVKELKILLEPVPMEPAEPEALSADIERIIGTELPRGLRGEIKQVIEDGVIHDRPEKEIEATLRRKVRFWDYLGWRSKSR